MVVKTEDRKTAIDYDGHQCEICMTGGCGIESLNLICDDCCTSLPILLKSVGELEPLRELYMKYQEAKEVVNCGGVDTVGDVIWLHRFVKELGKLLE